LCVAPTHFWTSWQIFMTFGYGSLWHKKLLELRNFGFPTLGNNDLADHELVR
jgi:hypothetical protein